MDKDVEDNYKKLGKVGTRERTRTFVFRILGWLSVDNLQAY